MSEPQEKKAIATAETAVTPEVMTPVQAPSEEPASVTHVILKRRDSAAWAVASIFIVGILAAAYVVYSVVYSLPSETIKTGGEVAKTVAKEASSVPERLAGALKPNVNITTVMASAIDNVKRDGKLIVMTADVDVEISKVSEKVVWEMLRLGDTTVRLRVRDNKVQYFIPMDGFAEDRITYDAETQSLRISVPPPQLDRAIVEVQSNPEFIEAETNLGWGRWSSGEFLMDAAQRELRDAVLREGANPLLQEKARQEAEETVRELFSGLRPHLREDVTIKVDFSSNPLERTAANAGT